ncbi:MAG: hypothetical protein MJZ37_07480 [Bacilli bacterium]|nr:hypothetical protein [Bacilli bacterium]
MGLRELAEKDLGFTLEDGNYGSARNITLSSPDGEEFQIQGWVNDIGYSYDTEGNAVSSRTISAMWRMSSVMKNGNYVVPGRGWECSFSDMTGKEWNCYVVRVEPDRTLGIARAWLSLDL